MTYNTTLPSPATQSFADWYQGRFNSPAEIIKHYWHAIEAAAESIGGAVTYNIITFDAKRKYIPNTLGKKTSANMLFLTSKRQKMALCGRQLLSEHSDTAGILFI